MAFNYQSSGGGGFGFNKSTPANNGNNSQVQAQTGSELQDIQTEGIGFQAIAGEAKVQLLPTPWPSNNLPQPTSCLLSIASRRGLLAAAGPDMVIVAYTENVRKAFEASGGNGNIKPFEPQLQLPMPFRISQLTFSADEEFLILSAETGGGLAVYEVQSLLNGSRESAFQIPTNNEAIRALVPNPAAEKGELIAVVTTEGKLMVANLKQKDFISGANGPILKEKVSCVSWSRLGKQLVVGLADGTSYQMTPEGVGKAEIPSPPSLSGDHHVSQILWLENSVFLTVHTPTSYDNSEAPSSEFHIVTKQPSASQNAQGAFGQASQQSQTTTYVFQKIAEPAGPFGLNRSPPHHFILRLKDFPPNLQDVLIVASSASTDVGLLTRSATPLESEKNITDVFTSTEPADDSRRATLPMNADGATDTSPIGLALDLSSKDFIYRPIPMDDEIDKSDGPLPGVMVLNNEGVLVAWWLVYSDSIRQKTTYPGLASQQSAQQPPAQQQSTQQQPAFGSNQTTSTAFGITPTFRAASAFGAGSGLGQKASPWGTASSSANTTVATTPATSPFGATSTFGASSAFGAGSGLGSKASPWATASSGNSTTATATPATSSFGSASFSTTSLPSALAGPANAFQSGTGPSQGASSTFGQPATFGSTALPGPKKSLWGSPSTSVSNTAATTISVPATGGFASFANKGGFAAASSSETSSGSAFAAKPNSGGFSGFSGGSNAFGQPEEKPKSIFGGLDQPSSMTTDPSNTPGKSTFGGSGLFGNINKPIDSNGNNPFGQNKVGGLFGTGPVSSMGNTAEKSNSIAQGKSSSVFSPGGFKLESSFKPDGSAKDDLPKPTGEDLFGPSFGNALSASQTPAPKDGFMSGINMESTTPSATPMLSKFNSGYNATKTGESGGFRSLFGTSTPSQPPKSNQDSFSVAGASTSAPSGNLFGNLKSSEPKSVDTITIEAPKPPSNSFGNLQTPAKSKSPETVTSTSPVNSDKGSTNTADVPEPDAPLPPDFSKTDAPLPPDFSKTDAPLPPDFFPKPVTKDIKENALPSVPLAEDSDGSDAHETGEETCSLQTDSDGGFSEEGSGVDVTKDLSPQSDSTKDVGATPQSSFGDRSVQKGPAALFSNVEKPTQSSSSRPLFGEVPDFPPPQMPRRPGSPRSPSPMRRSAVPNRMTRPDTLRSVSTPQVGGLGNFNNSQSSPFHLPAQGSSSMDHKIAEDARKAKEKAQKETKEAEEAQAKRAKAKAQKEAKEAQEAEETQAIIDYEDNLAQKQLSAEIVPTTVLDEFIAHQDYIGSTDRTGIPAQVETVYRDINSMVDTLGMNARALKAFIIGHVEGQKAGGRTKEDLENSDDDWVLVEIGNLTKIIEKDLTKELAENRVTDTTGKIQECSDLETDANNLRQKHEVFKNHVQRMADPALRESVLAAPLSKEQAHLQSEIRKEFQNFQDLLIEAEESLTVLKAKLVSRGGQPSANGNGVPTIEAVVRTISKMTAMAEKKSGDVDILEEEIRKMNLGPSQGPGSRDGSPFAANIRSPQNGHSTLRASTAARTPLRSSMMQSYSSSRSSVIFQTPDSVRSTTPTPNRGFGMSSSVLSRSRGSLANSMRNSIVGSPLKPTMENVPDEALLRASAKMAKKKAVAEQLRIALGRVGPRIVGMDDE